MIWDLLGLWQVTGLRQVDLLSRHMAHTLAHPFYDFSVQSRGPGTSLEESTQTHTQKVYPTGN